MFSAIFSSSEFICFSLSFEFYLSVNSFTFIFTLCKKIIVFPFISHSRFRDALVILEPLVVVDLVRMVRLVLAAFEDGKKALVDANVLLLSLHHPDPLLSHLVDDAEDVDTVVLAIELLKRLVTVRDIVVL